ncbi:snaclec alboaggregin-A subunit beta-like [Patiria miniata]|uniref:C-type lectin domain-containing protein n=1 Tax=Patiria miniata TaxID=46514 RepID=A0A914AL22_PATMI|nr:snaclec alboaggregin-A subunit beta-like [Patiria miniata]
MAALRDILVAFLFALGGFSILSALCPPGWKNWHQSCYAMYLERMSWADASEFCESKQSHLVVPNSQAENDFLWRRLVERFEAVQKRGVWIGCRWESVNANIVICDGNTERMSYTNWALGYPQQGAPRCVLLSKNGNGTWKTFNCEKPKYVVCEMPNTARVHCMTADANGRFVNGLP